MKYFIIGDIHGYLDKLTNLVAKIERTIRPSDKLVFLGDYIDRGPKSFEVVEFLISLSKKYNSIFLKGNHEAMFLDFLENARSGSIFLLNGGNTTIMSYKKNLGKFYIPDHHHMFFNKLKLYYESQDFIAVHAGLNPKIDYIQSQDEHDLLWLRDQFFRDPKKWDKTVIFGHTPTITLPGQDVVYFDDDKNIIGIDGGVIYGLQLICLVWPDKKIITS